MTQKIYIKKIILITILFSTFFILANIVNAETEYLDTSTENKVKVCKDNTCTNPTPGIIYFEISGESPLVIDTKNGLSGKVWGDELGWVTFNPPYGGVFFADSTTGLLKGTAWSENSGAINFSVTGQKVVIDPKTGEWNGWAWASGPYGGWIKFDCKDTASCVHTVWNNKISENVQPLQKLSFLKNIFVTKFINLFNKMTTLKSNIFNKIGDSYYSFSSNLIILRGSVFEGLNNLFK